MRFLWSIPVLIVVLSACTSEPEDQALPILGEKEIVAGDTVFHSIPDFAFYNQDSTLITSETLDDKIYVTDFFFTSCPTICPKMKKEMLRLYEKYQATPELMLVSHSIDPKRDTVGKLKEYAQGLGVSSDKWHFLTGDKDEIYKIADDYFSIAMEDPEAPGGFNHSGRFILVDKKGHIRSFADGTNAQEVDRLMGDIDQLLAEQ